MVLQLVVSATPTGAALRWLFVKPHRAFIKDDFPVPVHPRRPNEVHLQCIGDDLYRFQFFRSGIHSGSIPISIPSPLSLFLALAALHASPTCVEMASFRRFDKI
jgi:hypothetical protein